MIRNVCKNGYKEKRFSFSSLCTIQQNIIPLFSYVKLHFYWRNMDKQFVACKKFCNFFEFGSLQEKEAKDFSIFILCFMDNLLFINLCSLFLHTLHVDFG